MNTDTKSSLKMTGGITDYFTINRGGRQGSSLIPTLFKMYINDMTELFINSNVIHYLRIFMYWQSNVYR